MLQDFQTPDFTYRLHVDQLVCNKFGLAEFFAYNFEEFRLLPLSRVLDVGCGVGPFSIFLASQNIHVTGVEINPKAVGLCRMNVEKYGFSSLVSLLEDDFSSVYMHDTFDIIISNPPIDPTLPLDDMNCLAQDLNLHHLTPRTFSYITNSWHDLHGKELCDYIFLRGKKLLSKNGNVIIICGNTGYDIRQHVCSKAYFYGYQLINDIKTFLSTVSVGINDSRLFGELIEAHILVYSYSL